MRVQPMILNFPGQALLADIEEFVSLPTYLIPLTAMQNKHNLLHFKMKNEILRRCSLHFSYIAVNLDFSPRGSLVTIPLVG